MTDFTLPESVTRSDARLGDAFNSFPGVAALLESLDDWAKGYWAFVDLPDLYWKNTVDTAVIAINREALADSNGLGGFILGKEIARNSPDEFMVKPFGPKWIVVRLWWD